MGKAVFIVLPPSKLRQRASTVATLFWSWILLKKQEASAPPLKQCADGINNRRAGDTGRRFIYTHFSWQLRSPTSPANKKALKGMSDNILSVPAVFRQFAAAAGPAVVEAIIHPVQDRPASFAETGDTAVESDAKKIKVVNCILNL